MSLAEGKVVLALEGGYELNGLAECGKLCVEALLNRPVISRVFFGPSSFHTGFCLLVATIQPRNHGSQTEC